MVLARTREHTSPYWIPNNLTPLLPASSFQTWSTQVSFLDLLPKTQRVYPGNVQIRWAFIRTLYSRKIDHYKLLESVIRDETSALIISSIITTIVNDVLTTRYVFLQSSALNICTLTNKHVAENAQYIPLFWVDSSTSLYWQGLENQNITNTTFKTRVLQYA